MFERLLIPFRDIFDNCIGVWSSYVAKARPWYFDSGSFIST